ncbi:hypothetical protein QUB70_10425 [Microcoleus sp. A003_D6]
MPVPKQVIENGAISQSEVRSQKSEGKKSEGKKSDGSRPMEVVRWKSEEGKKEEGKKQLFRIPNALFGKCPETPNLPEKGYTTDSTVKLFLAKINQKKAALLSW